LDGFVVADPILRRLDYLKRQARVGDRNGYPLKSVDTIKHVTVQRCQDRLGDPDRDLVNLFKDETHTPSVFAEIDKSMLADDSFSLLGVSRVNSVYKGVMNLTAMRGAKDFQADDSIEFHALDDHHIFP
jgi:hypothetical protein